MSSNDKQVVCNGGGAGSSGASNSSGVSCILGP